MCHDGVLGGGAQQAGVGRNTVQTNNCWISSSRSPLLGLSLSCCVELIHPLIQVFHTLRVPTAVDRCMLCAPHVELYTNHLRVRNLSTQHNTEESTNHTGHSKSDQLDTDEPVQSVFFGQCSVAPWSENKEYYDSIFYLCFL